MAASSLAAVMDGIGAALTAWGGVRNVYTYPGEAIVDPCALVDFPTRIVIGTTFGRGSDTLTIPVLLLAGQSYMRETRDALSALISGGADAIAAIEGPHAWGSAHVEDVDVTPVVVGGITYLALKITVEVST